MHKQPDNIWRIDDQLRDDEDPEEAVKPENVIPRVRSHLKMMGSIRRRRRASRADLRRAWREFRH
jgi:hypothetical protein